MFDTKSVEAELDEIFLSILLKNGQLIYNVIDRVLPGMLIGENNRLLYKTMIVLAKKNIQPSRLLVKNDLIKEDKFNRIGGDTYLRQLLQINTADEQLEGVVHAIIDNYRRVELFRLSNSIQTSLKNQETLDIISNATRELNNLVGLGNESNISLLAETLEESIKVIEERRKHPGLQGCTTGFSNVNEHTTGYQPGEMWFIGARPSMGKTSLLLKSLYEVAKTEEPVLLINKEMTPLALNDRLYSMVGRVPLQKIRRGDVDDTEMKRIQNAKKLLDTLPFYIDHKWDYIGNENYIFSAIRQYKMLQNIKVVGVDYIQLLVPRSSESTHLLGALSRGLKVLSGELDITIIVLSQLNREVEKRDNKRPIMSDLRQSGNLEEDADYMVALYRDEMYTENSPDRGKLEYIIRKARNAPIGTFYLSYDGETTNIYDSADLPTEWVI